MISLIEVSERAHVTGPKTSEQERDMTMFRAMNELVKRHNLEYKGPTDVLEVPDEYADRAFAAAVDFLAEVGVYCVTTGRSIRFTEDEVWEAAKQAPREVNIGSGREARTVYSRDYEDRRPPRIRGNGHRHYPEIIGAQIMKCFAHMPRTDIVEGYNFTVVEGREIRGLPMEVSATRREAALMREAVRSAGRPGLSITLYPISTNPAALIAAMDPENCLRKSDGVLLSVLPEVKCESGMLAAAIAYEEYGGYKVNGASFALIGGFCGGPEGAVVESICQTLAAWLVYRDTMHYTQAIEGYFEQRVRGMSVLSTEKAKTVTKRPPLWTSLVPNNAVRRNAGLIRWSAMLGGRVAGGEPGTVSYYVSQAGSVMASTVFGLQLDGGWTPFDISFVSEVSDATLKAGIKRDEVPEILKRVDERCVEALKAESHIVSEQGFVRDRRILAYVDWDEYYRQMSQVYDFTRGRPTVDTLRNCEGARRELAEAGLPL